MQKVTLQELKGIYPELDGKLDNLKGLSEGRHGITDDVFVIISEYDTKEREEKEYESHKAYLDVQLVLEGRENILVKPVSQLTESVPYDKDKDVMFFRWEEGGTDYPVNAGDALILLPEDGHMPGVDFSAGTHERVRKAVIKIPV